MSPTFAGKEYEVIEWVRDGEVGAVVQRFWSGGSASSREKPNVTSARGLPKMLSVDSEYEAGFAWMVWTVSERVWSW